MEIQRSGVGTGNLTCYWLESGGTLFSSDLICQRMLPVPTFPPMPFSSFMDNAWDFTIVAKSYDLVVFQNLSKVRKCLGFSKSHGKYRLSLDLDAFSKSHGKDSAKVAENTDLALTWMLFLKVTVSIQQKSWKI